MFGAIARGSLIVRPIGNVVLVRWADTHVTRIPWNVHNRTRILWGDANGFQVGSIWDMLGDGGLLFTRLHRWSRLHFGKNIS